MPAPPITIADIADLLGKTYTRLVAITLADNTTPDVRDTAERALRRLAIFRFSTSPLDNPIQEFEADPSYTLDQNGDPVATWHQTRAIDLRQVASIAPWQPYPQIPQVADITLAGSNRTLILNVPYLDIVARWRELLSQ